jgi:hypothetical protein
MVDCRQLCSTRRRIGWTVESSRGAPTPCPHLGRSNSLYAGRGRVAGLAARKRDIAPRGLGEPAAGFALARRLREGGSTPPAFVTKRGATAARRSPLMIGRGGLSARREVVRFAHASKGSVSGIEGGERGEAQGRIIQIWRAWGWQGRSRQPSDWSCTWGPFQCQLRACGCLLTSCRPPIMLESGTTRGVPMPARTGNGMDGQYSGPARNDRLPWH